MVNIALFMTAAETGSGVRGVLMTIEKGSTGYLIMIVSPMLMTALL